MIFLSCIYIFHEFLLFISFVDFLCQLIGLDWVGLGWTGLEFIFLRVSHTGRAG